MRWLFLAVLGLCLVGCTPDKMNDADTEIYNMIKTFQKEHTKSGTCESRALFEDDIRLPYTLWVCVD